VNKKIEKAVIDRITGEVATLLVGDNEKEMLVDLEKLPEGIKEGDWLEIDEEENFRAAPNISEVRKKVVMSKLDKLRQGSDL